MAKFEFFKFNRDFFFGNVSELFSLQKGKTTTPFTGETLEANNSGF